MSEISTYTLPRQSDLSSHVSTDVQHFEMWWFVEQTQRTMRKLRGNLSFRHIQTMDGVLRGLQTAKYADCSCVRHGMAFHSCECCTSTQYMTCTVQCGRSTGRWSGVSVSCMHGQVILENLAGNFWQDRWICVCKKKTWYQKLPTISSRRSSASTWQLFAT